MLLIRQLEAARDPRADFIAIDIALCMFRVPEMHAVAWDVEGCGKISSGNILGGKRTVVARMPIGMCLWAHDVHCNLHAAHV